MEYEKLKYYERYWRANQSIEQRIMAMKSAETSITPQAGDGSQHIGAHDPMQSVDKRMKKILFHSLNEQRANREQSNRKAALPPGQRAAASGA